MTKEQIKRYYRHFCRWQQAEPHYVNRHQDSVQNCHNCGTEFADNFCPRCGQRAEVGRVGWNSVKESVALLWGMDSRSLTYTLVQLLGRPGYLVRDYISGRRLVSFPPVKMLVIVCLFVVIFEIMYMTYHQLFGYRWWGTLWRFAVVELTFYQESKEINSNTDTQRVEKKSK